MRQTFEMCTLNSSLTSEVVCKSDIYSVQHQLSAAMKALCEDESDVESLLELLCPSQFPLRCRATVASSTARCAGAPTEPGSRSSEMGPLRDTALFILIISI